jgi:hypothetical protein
MPAPESLRILSESLNGVAVPMLQKAFRGPMEERADYLNGWLVTAKALVRFAMDAGPVVFSGQTPKSIAAAVAPKLIEGTKDFAVKAGLDDHESETLVLATQRAMEQVVAERQSEAGSE